MGRNAREISRVSTDFSFFWQRGREREREIEGEMIAVVVMYFIELKMKFVYYSLALLIYVCCLPCILYIYTD